MYFEIILFLITLLGISVSGVSIIKLIYIFGRKFDFSPVQRYCTSDLQLIGFISYCFFYVVLGLTSLLNLRNFLICVFLSLIPGFIYGIKLFSKRILGLSHFILLCIITVLPSLLISFAVSLHPTSNWDSISYTLSFPKIHINENNLRFISEHTIFSAFPLYGEAALGFPMLIRNNELITQMLMSYFSIIVLLKSYNLYYFYNKNILYALLTLFVIANLPISLNNFGIAKVEICQAVFLLASLSALVSN